MAIQPAWMVTGDRANQREPILTGDGPFSILATGLIAGWIAQRIVDRRLSLWACLGLGLLGAICGAFLAGLIDLNLQGPIGALALYTTGSVLILALYTLLHRGR